MDNDNVPKFIPSRDDNSLIAKKYENDFAKITLTRQVDENPVVFKGSGSISQDEDRQLVLKVFHEYTKDHRERDFFPRGTPGVFIGKDRLFRLSAIDMSGKEWIAEDVHVSFGIKEPSIGRKYRLAQLRIIASTNFHLPVSRWSQFY